MCRYKEAGSGTESEDAICLAFYNSASVAGFET